LDTATEAEQVRSSRRALAKTLANTAYFMARTSGRNSFSRDSIYTRRKNILQQLSRPQFLQGFEFTRAKQMGEKCGKFQNHAKIMVLRVVIISTISPFCLFWLQISNFQ